MAPDEHLRLSGFKRILVRLDDGTRRKYCCQALGEDLERAGSEMDACVAAAAQVKQVADATRRLEASLQRAAVSEELLIQLETLQTQLETTAARLFSDPMPQIRNLNMENAVKEEDTSGFEEAKALVKQILGNGKVDEVVSWIKKLERKVPVLADVDEKKRKWWKKHMRKVVSHGLELVADEKKLTSYFRLLKATRKVVHKCPELEDWLRDVEMHLEKIKQNEETAALAPDTEAPTTKSKKKRAATLPDDGESTKSKKKRAVALPDDGESAVASGTLTKSATGNATGASSKEKKSESVEQARSLLNRCSREVRTLREKFELGAYDVNLSRMVTVVDSLWPGFEHSEVVSLTTALFTLVETVVKVVSVEKRRDRLVCLESVLGVVLGSTKLHLTTRRKIMVEEYANNCRQSLEQLNRQLSGAPAEAAESTSSPAVTSRTVARDSQGSLAKSHVRFG